jgi:hypothetical protein
MQIELLIEGNAALADAVDKSRIDIAAIIGHEDRSAAQTVTPWIDPSFWFQNALVHACWGQCPRHTQMS